MATSRIIVPEWAFEESKRGVREYWMDERNQDMVQIIDGRVYLGAGQNVNELTEVLDFDIETTPLEGSSGPTVSSVNSILNVQEALEACASVGVAGSMSDFISSINNSEFGSIEGFNNYIKENVTNAGYGTREGVIAAALSLAGGLSEIAGIKYFYTWPSQETTHNGMAQQEGISADGTTYLDCRAFVQWAVYNGGYDASALEYYMSDLTSFSQIAPIKSDVRTAQPGDIFSTGLSGSTHTWLVVEVTEDGYYAAEEFGTNGGATINFYSWDDALNGYDAQLFDMQGFYSNSSNVR